MSAIVAKENTADASTIFGCVDTISGAIAVAIANCVFVNRATDGIQCILPDTPRAIVQETVTGVGASLTDQLSSSVRTAVLQATLDAIKDVWIQMIATAALSLILSFFMRTFLESYEKSLPAFLDTPEDIERKVEIRTMNQILHSKTILYEEPDMRYQNALKAVTEPAKLRYYSDYGDYVAFLCTSFRQKCVEAKVDKVDILIGKSWGQVLTELKREDEVREEWYDNHKQGEKPPFYAISKTLSNACVHLGLNFQNVRYCIEWYTDRNKKAHSGVPFYIKNCDWKSLAHRLWQDWDGIPGVFGNEDKKMMKEALTRVRDEFFIQLTALKHVPSTQANILSQKKLDTQFARTKYAEDQKLAAAKKAEAKQKREQDRSNQALERKEGRKRVERRSKPSGDSWQDQEDSLGLKFYGRS
ncbi:MAG: hypothetical protein Q9188_004062 [Gyalolechia gomerana]